MSARPVQFVLALALVLAVAGGGRVWAQDTAKPKDDALDSLLEKLDESGEGRVEIGQASQGRTATQEAGPSRQSRKQTRARRRPPSKTGKRPRPRTTSRPRPSRPTPAQVSPKDQALDDLLGKLGETKDEPTPRRSPRNGGPGARSRTSRRRVPRSPAPTSWAARTRTSTSGSRS